MMTFLGFRVQVGARSSQHAREGERKRVSRQCEREERDRQRRSEQGRGERGGGGADLLPEAVSHPGTREFGHGEICWVGPLPPNRLDLGFVFRVGGLGSALRG